MVDGSSSIPARNSMCNARWATALGITERPASGNPEIHASSRWETRINGLAVRQLTLPAAAARHPFGRMYELKLAPHVRRGCSGKIGYYPTRVMRNEIG
jgi:hypothetical protein